MADNGTNNGGGSNNNNNGNGSEELAVGVVALVISLVALLGTVAQVLQQYYASAAGFANCGENVMGEWYKTTKRIFRPTELRFEVQFEVPVIFVCLPDNKRGPVKDAPIHFVSGTEESLRNTRTLSAKEEEKQRQPTRENKVHTADNERCTWVTLLSHLHAMERTNREWVAEHYPGVIPEDRLEGEAHPELRGHSLCVAVQAKPRSWDNMPVDVKKPYAITTICHLVEIAAMLGIYWREWDRSRDRYRAEGNGFILTGTTVTDLGLMFTFQICGASSFQDSRIIPVDEAKELCCGSVSTIFRAGNDVRRLGSLNEDPRELGVLQLGSLNEIAETMVLLQCNTQTARYFRRPNSKHTHLFPVPFELMGMLAKSLHIKTTPYRTLPNPTPYHWDKNFFNLRKLLIEYQKHLTLCADSIPWMKKFLVVVGKVVVASKKNHDKEKELRASEKKLLLAKTQMLERQRLDKKASIKVLPKNVAQTTGVEKSASSWPSLQTITSKLRSRKPTAKRDEESQTPPSEIKIQIQPAPEQPKPAAANAKKPTRPGYTMELLDTLHDAVEECDTFLLQRRRALVTTVLREHFQEVLKMLNDDDEEDEPGVGTGKRADAASIRGRRAQRFEDLISASPEERQKKFMDIYFGEVLHEVKKRAASSFSKMTFYNGHEIAMTPTSPTKSPFLKPQDTLSPDVSDIESGNEEDAKEGAERMEPDAASIWCVLVLRMLCWLSA